MSIYNFSWDDSPNPQKLTDMNLRPKTAEGKKEEQPAIPTSPPALPIAGGQQRTDLWFERQNVSLAEEIKDNLPQGYRTMDRGLKNYFAGMQIPTKDGIKMMGVRVSGGDKPYLVWAQDLRMGRVTLPCMSISRESDADYPQKYSPAYGHWMSKRFLNQEGSRVALIPRPVPALINYTLSVWAEHKRDLEYIFTQVRTRFNPIAEFFCEDEFLRGGVILRYNGQTVKVDTDIPADQRSNKRYDFAVTMEGWLPLPERMMPTILGRVTSLEDGLIPTRATVLDVISGKAD